MEKLLQPRRLFKIDYYSPSHGGKASAKMKTLSFTGGLIAANHFIQHPSLSSFSLQPLLPSLPPRTFNRMSLSRVVVVVVIVAVAAAVAAAAIVRIQWTTSEIGSIVEGIICNRV